MKKGILLLSSLIFPFLFLSQTTQTVRGRIVDKETFSPIIGATILVTTETSKILGASTDLDGNYRIEGVSLGRHSIRITYIGYYNKNVPSYRRPQDLTKKKKQDQYDIRSLFI